MTIIDDLQKTASASDAPGDEAPARPFAYDVAIVGLGYVGLPTALAYFAAGSSVLALDVSSERLASITARTADLIPTDHERLGEALGDPRFRITSDVGELPLAASIIVCVPTPVDDEHLPELTSLRRACSTIVRLARPGQLIMLTSTSYVGCTDELLVGPLSMKGLVVGHDVHVAFSAERIDPGNSRVAQEAVPRVVGGATDACRAKADALLRRYSSDVHGVASAAAEMTKLLENTFRAVNIALANEFADICAAFDVPVIEVIDAAATKPYGFMPFFPGPGVGGHCIPCDPHYLLWQLRAMQVEAPLITTAMARIAARPSQVVDRVAQLASAGAIADARILVVGVAYKPDVADLRESTAIEILSALDALGAQVAYTDPLVPEIVLASGSRLSSLDEPGSFSPTLVLVHTLHSGTDLTWIADDTTVLDTTYRSSAPGDVVTI